MAATTSPAASSPVSGADLERAESFAREPFLHEGEDPGQALAEGTPRRRALDTALAELDAGRSEPAVGWRREFALMLGLERLLSQDQPHLADGTELSAHQVDALSGTLIALVAEVQNGARHPGDPAGAARPAVDPGDAPASDPEGDDTLPEEEEPLDWEPEAPGAEEDDEVEGPPEALEDANAARRFWFEHATGAGKTVAALGFVEASRTGGVLILTHRRNLVEQFQGELLDRGYRSRVSPAILDRGAS